MTQEDALRICKSLSDLSRLRIMKSLTQGEMYTELLAERLDLTPSTVSFHMKKLEEAGLVVSRKEQYYTIYALNQDLLEASLFDVISSEPEETDEGGVGRTLTCIGFRPLPDDVAHQISKKYQLYR